MKIFSKQFWFARFRGKQLRAIKQRRERRFTFVESTIRNSTKVVWAKFLGRDKMYYFNISKFDSYKKPFVTIASLPELYFIYRTFILLVQTKEVISMSYSRPCNVNLSREWFIAQGRINFLKMAVVMCSSPQTLMRVI